jgi:REP element-mobilizing transposase RayT
MARKRRIEFAGALYHVLARGNQRQRIFRSKHDFTRYLELLSEYKERYCFSLFSYVLMPNHVHLLIETAQVPLSKIMQGLNQSYTMYFNRRHETVGHLFQGRYKGILCDRDEYLLTLIKYIHLNPVRARVAELASDYPWSSHLTYAAKSRGGSLVDTDLVHSLFSDDKATAIKHYLSFINTGPNIDRKDIYRTVDQRLLGDEQFVEAVKNRVPDQIRGEKRQRLHSLEKIAQAIENVTAVSVDQLRARTKERKVADSRMLLCKVAKEFTYRNHEIADFLRKDPAAVTRYLKEGADMEAIKQVVLDSLED